MIKCFINEIDTTTYNLALEGYSISAPVVRTVTVEIPGRNGVLDYSTALTGKPTYNNRTITLVLGTYGNGASRDNACSNLLNEFYGQKVLIGFSNLDGTYEGRITTFSKFTNLLHTTLTISIDCYPFRTLEDGSESL